MGTVTTEYDVRLRYLMENRPVVTGAQQMTQELRKAETASAGLSLGLGRIGAMVAGYFGIGAAKRAMVDYNSTMEQSRIQMAGLMAQAGRGDFASNLGVAADLMRQMRDDSAKTVGTLQDYVQMASMLVQPLTMAGGQVKDIREMTRLSVVASRAMGIDAIVSARDVDQAIRGMYRSVDQFTGKLLTPLGYGGEEGRRKFNAMSMQQRYGEIVRSMKTQAIESMAQAQENTWEGVWSTFVSIAQQTGGQVGMPLFKRLTTEFKTWNDWLMKNEARVNHIADILGNKIVQAAVSFKNAVQFAAEHWKTIAAAYGAMKAAGYLATAGGGLAAAGGAAGAAGATFGMKAATVSLIASAVYIGATELADWINNRHERGLEAAGRFDENTVRMFAAAKQGVDAKSARSFYSMAQMQGLAGPGGSANESALRAGIEQMDMDQRKKVAEALGMTWNAANTYAEPLAREAAKQFATYFREAMNGAQAQENMSRGMPELKKPEKAKINVTINRIEVASDDPDRWAMGFTDWVRSVARNPANAMHTIREAG